MRRDVALILAGEKEPDSNHSRGIEPSLLFRLAGVTGSSISRFQTASTAVCGAFWC